MTRFIVPALLMTGLVACTNAPAEEGPKPILREEFAEEFTTAFCDAWEACDCAEGMQVPGLFDENCQTRAATRMERWLSSLEEEGRIYDAECAQSWIESIAQAGCTSFHPEPTCEIVMGTADWSESCERTEDCLNGFKCTGISCRRGRLTGEACGGGGEAGGFVCRDALVCGPDNQCAERASSGEPCEYNGHCAGAATCQDGRCVQTDVGDPCTTDAGGSPTGIRCSRGQRCRDDECVATEAAVCHYFK